MASVFTFDPDPPRISSPWLGTPVSTPRLEATGELAHERLLGGLLAPPPALLSDSNIVKLDAEPQDGPIEYKLHLLLRPRRSFTSMTTGPYVLGSYLAKSKSGALKAGSSASKIVGRGSSSTPPFQARQKRLEHLTTQLLWRLQQSSPYHSSSTMRLVPPALPETGPVLGPPANTGKLLPGLEDSRGALYEIGVSDDGVFVGLTRDEMDESLINLRAMSASLGCKVEILRTVIVGDCEWTEGIGSGETAEGSSPLLAESVRKEKLWVVEALVLPDTQAHSSKDAPVSPLDASRNSAASAIKVEEEGYDAVPPEDSHTEQLRISLTGGTTAGKSSLVGTLSTSALDSGRGKTRLNLLKHRHEIESGITSSVAPELIGYSTLTNQTDGSHVTSVVNYGSGNVSSWNDVHNAAEGERLVFLVDSAGHPRYRRTTVRGLVSWAPHWTLCCIAADEERDFGSGLSGGTAATGEEGGGLGVSDADFSTAHLGLCLKLGLPLVVVLTKLDTTTNQGLRSTLSKVLSVLKAYQRNPAVLRPDATPRVGEELQHIHTRDEDEVRSVIARNGIKGLVPIVFTSAVKGSGISKLHALLRWLPIPQADEHVGHILHDTSESVFYVDEIFSRLETPVAPSAGDDAVPAAVFVLSGRLGYGDLSVGDVCLLGPFSAAAPELRPVEMGRTRSYPARLSSSPVSKLSHSDPRPQSHLNVIAPSPAQPVPDRASPVDDAGTSATEWIPVRIISIRNLRLPLRRLLADQVGTVGIEFVNHTERAHAAPKLRKGMVLVRQTPYQTELPQACSGFKAVFAAGDYHVMEPGAPFSVYTASVRASAKIMSVEARAASPGHPNKHVEQTNTGARKSDEQEAEAEAEDEGLFMFDGDAPQSSQAQDSWAALYSSSATPSGRPEVRSQPLPPKEIEVCFCFTGPREWIEAGGQVLVMPKTVAEGSSGLDGFVGKVSEVSLMNAVGA